MAEVVIMTGFISVFALSICAIGGILTFISRITDW